MFFGNHEVGLEKAGPLGHNRRPRQQRRRTRPGDFREGVFPRPGGAGVGGQKGYGARLTGTNGAAATQSVNGQATRYKVVGRDAADDLMSEIFTDMVNTLNMARLLEQAGV